MQSDLIGGGGPPALYEVAPVRAPAPLIQACLRLKKSSGDVATPGVLARPDVFRLARRERWLALVDSQRSRNRRRRSGHVHRLGADGFRRRRADGARPPLARRGSAQTRQARSHLSSGSVSPKISGFGARPRRHRLVPSRQVLLLRRYSQLDQLGEVDRDQRRDVGDGIPLAGDEFAFREEAVDHSERPLCSLAENSRRTPPLAGCVP